MTVFWGQTVGSARTLVLFTNMTPTQKNVKNEVLNGLFIDSNALFATDQHWKGEIMAWFVPIFRPGRPLMVDIT